VNFATRLSDVDPPLDDARFWARVERYAEAQRRVRATLIARTELAQAATAGQQKLWDLAIQSGALDKTRMRKRWMVTRDSVLESICEALGEEEVEIDEPFSNGLMGPPAHPSCLPADALVTAGGRITAVSKRWYQGDLVVVSTATGKQLSCTPNHPILTDRGWVAARLLHEGAYVMSRALGERMSAVNVHNDHPPTRIHEIANTYRVSSSVRSRAVMLSTPHFHGDGMDGQIAVIWSNSTLWDRKVPGRDQSIGHDLFQDRHAPTYLRGMRTLQEFVECLLTTTHSSMRSFHEMISFCLAQFRPSPFIALANAGAAGMTRAHLLLSEFGSTQAIPQRTSRRARIEVAGRRSDDDSSIRKHVSDANLPYAIPSREALHRFAGLVAVDRIVHVEGRRFEGHVYNLETETGWYAAEGMITHNCRCATGLVRVEKAAHQIEPRSTPHRHAATVRAAIVDSFGALRAALYSEVSGGAVE